LSAEFAVAQAELAVTYAKFAVYQAEFALVLAVVSSVPDSNANVFA
jgi:hypothetical protein